MYFSCCFSRLSGVTLCSIIRTILAHWNVWKTTCEQSLIERKSVKNPTWKNNHFFPFLLSLSLSTLRSMQCRAYGHNPKQMKCHHHHLSLNREGIWGTTDDFATSFFHFSLFSTALWDLANSRPVHSLMLSSHLSLCLPCLLPSFTVPCKMVLARPNEWETWPYHYSLRLFTMARRSLCGPIACWILAQTSSLVTWSLYEMHSILR